MKSIKISDYFKIIKPSYVYLKLIPDTSIRNYNSSNIAKSMALMYKNIFNCIKKQEKKFVIETQVKCSYLIDITKDDIGFYFIVPLQYCSIIKEKIRETWKRCTIEEVEEIENFSNNAVKYELYYKKEDALSLNVDRRNNEPLNSILNVVEIMKDNDRIGIFYNFIPCAQMPWRAEYKRTINKLKAKEPIDKEKFTLNYTLKIGLTYIIKILDDIVSVTCELFGAETKKKEDLSLLEAVATSLNFNDGNKLSSSTLKKQDSLIINGQIMVVSESKDNTRAYNNANSVCQSYKALEEDNELIYKSVKNTWHISDFKVAKIESNTFSIDECSNFIQLPGRELQDQFKSIKKINTLESEVPEELRSGTKQLGENTFKGTKTTAYLTNDKDYKNLALAIIGPTRSGKTSLLGNIAKDSIDAGECTIVLDYIENCGLSEEIKSVLEKDKVLEINLHDFTKLQGLGYNEAFAQSNDPFLIYESAKKQTSQVMTLINSINISNSDFTPRMERFLSSACLVTFIQNKSIKDVLKVLQNHKYRHEILSSIPKNQFDNLEEYIEDLKELDEWSKVTRENPTSEIIGTKTSFISGVIDRFNKLKSNTYMELMLKKDCTENINLLHEMEKNQVIFIKMPESMFSTAEERDIMTTYWLTKIWIAAQTRAWNIQNRYDRKTVTVITDEIAQLKASEEFVGNKLDQTAKFGVKFILSTMYINQLRIREKLRTANTSYIFISGSEKSNFKELKEEFEQHGYTLEDMMNLKRYYSLNYIKYSGGYWAGITKLPKPLPITNIS